MSSRADKYELKKYGVYSFVGSLLLTGLIGALAFIFGQFGDLELRIMGTVISLGFFVVLGLSTAIWLDTDKKYLTYIGALMSITGFALTMDLLWQIEFLSSLIGSDIYFRSILTNNVLLTALAISSVLFTVKTEDKVIKILRNSSIVLTILTAIVVTGLINIELTATSPIRLAGSLAVIGTATTISTFILNKFRD